MAVAYALSEFLRKHRIGYEVLWHPHAETGLGVARNAGVPAGRVVKAVVMQSAGELLVVLVPANRRLRVGAVADYLGADARIADPALWQSIFADCDPGAVPATASAYGVRTLLDESLAKGEDLYFDAGDQEELIHVSGAAFRDALADVERGRFAAQPAA